MSNIQENNERTKEMYKQLAIEEYERIILDDRIDKRIDENPVFKEKFIEMYVKLSGYKNSNNVAGRVNVSIGDLGEVLLTIHSYQPEKVLKGEDTEIGETKNEQIKFEINTHQDIDYLVCTDTETTERFKPSESIVVVRNDHNKIIWFGNEQVGQIMINRKYSYSSSSLRPNTYRHDIELPIEFILQSKYPNSLFDANGGYDIEKCSVLSKKIGSGIIKVASKSVDWTQFSVNALNERITGKKLVDDIEWQIHDLRYPGTLFGDTFASMDNLTNKKTLPKNFTTLDEAIAAYKTKYQNELNADKKNSR